MKKNALLFLGFYLAIASAQASGWSLEFFAQPNEPVPPGISLQQLITLTNDRDSNKNYLNLMVDQNHQAAGMYNLPDAGNKSGKDDAKGKNVYWLQEIESPNGAVLAKGSGRDALILLGKLDRGTQEGRFTVKYLANGLSMRYEACDFLLKRTVGSDSWHIQNAYDGSTVTNIRVTTWMMGIESLEGICPKK